MKKYIFLFVLFSSCFSYNNVTIRKFNKLTPPVILVGKVKVYDYYLIIVKDGKDLFYEFDDWSDLSDVIANTYNVGDTIKKIEYKKINN